MHKEKEPYAFLGQYLVGHGLITPEQLAEAIRLQEENNAITGSIALARGLLDQSQLNHLITLQSRIDERLGRLAVAEGFMNEAALDTILSIQGRNHIYLGDSLVRMGIITRHVLDQALADFENQTVSREMLIREEVSALTAAREALVTLDVTLRFFYRLGYVIRVVRSHDRVPPGFNYLYCCEQVFRRTGTGHMGLGIDDLLAESITHGSTLRTRCDKQAADGMEAMSQLVFNLNYLVCKQMQRQGIRVRHGHAFMDLPSNISGENICLELETLTSPMVFYYLAPGSSDGIDPQHP